jgi:hypothetical protein
LLARLAPSDPGGRASQAATATTAVSLDHLQARRQANTDWGRRGRRANLWTSCGRVQGRREAADRDAARPRPHALPDHPGRRSLYRGFLDVPLRPGGRPGKGFAYGIARYRDLIRLTCRLHCNLAGARRWRYRPRPCRGAMVDIGSAHSSFAYSAAKRRAGHMPAFDAGYLGIARIC